MTDPKTPPPPALLWREVGVQYYLAVAGGGLALVFLVLNQRGVPFHICLLPLFVGVGGAAIGFARVPLVYLIVLGIVMSIDVEALLGGKIETNHYLMSSRGGNVWLSDVLLCAGVLAFVAGQYRLQSLLKTVFPQALSGSPGATKSSAGVPAPAGPRRASLSVSPREVGTLLLVLPAWALAAQFVAALLPTNLANALGPAGALDGQRGLHPAVWRAMTLFWLLAVAALVVAGVLDYYHRRHMTPTEATLYLQDVLWRETRREQRRIDRWRAWGRLGFPLDFLDRINDIVVHLWLAVLIVGLVAIALWLYVSLSS